MCKYRFSLCSYHAIKEADIIIDAITVLAGPNGCGKSTISRWLYYMIDVFRLIYIEHILLADPFKCLNSYRI